MVERRKKLTSITGKVGVIDTTRQSTSPACVRLGGRPWRRIRDTVLMRDDYLCQSCLPGRVSVASEVDHIIPLHLGGGNGVGNLQSLCVSCHQAKSLVEGESR